jgi:hypothetical protein
MPADARLTLIERLRQFPDRQFAFRQQGESAQTRLLSGGLERADHTARLAALVDRQGWRYKHIFI